MSTYPEQVTIVEVGPRDGLQNEPEALDTASKIEFIDRLSATGLAVIETTSMVHPQRVPQLADGEAVCRQIRRRQGVRYPALVPNLKGLERALGAGVQEIAVLTAASEAFCQKNINCSMAESLRRLEPVMKHTRSAGIRVRAYISCALGCPYEGAIDPARVAELAQRLHTLGCAEIALGDTSGVATPLQARQLVSTVAADIPIGQLAIHFHDTRGQGLANILACLELGITVVDAAVAGLGGCPFMQNARGNVATEDLVYMLTGMGITTDVDLDGLIAAGRFICQRLGRENQSRVGRIGAQHGMRS